MKKIYYAVLIAGGLVIGAYLFIRFSLQKDVAATEVNPPKEPPAKDSSTKKEMDVLNLQPLFIAKLKQLVKKGSDGLYDLSIDSISVDVLKSTATLFKVRLNHDDDILKSLLKTNKAPENVFNGSFQQLFIDGINLDDVVTHKTIDFGSVRLIKPRLEVWGQKKAATKKNLEQLYQRIMEEMKSIVVKNLLVDEGRLTYHPYHKNKAIRLNHFALRLNQIKIDSTSTRNNDRFLFAKSGVLSIKNYEGTTADQLYLLKIKKLTFATPEKMITLNDISLSSKYTKQELRKRLKHRQEQYDLSVPKVSIKNVEWDKLISEERLTADALIVSHPRLKVFLDRSLPPAKSKMGAFPAQLLMKLPLKMAIKKFEVNNLNLAYEEYNPRSQRSGTVYFDNVMLRARNLTNLPGTKSLTVAATADFMHHIPVTANFVFDMAHTKKGAFSSKISTGAFNGESVNSIAVPLGLVKIDKGTVQGTKVSIKGDEDAAAGNVSLLYNDLKLSLYEKESDESGLDKKGLIGLLANALVIKDNNPKKGEAPRKPNADFKRDPQAGFFNLVWKTALVGILKTIGANPKLAAKKQ